MKITDDQLMKAIWLYQLKRMAKGVVDHYVGQSFATRESSDSNFYYSSYMYFGETKNIHTELATSQRRVRVKRLIQQGRLHQQGNDSCFYFNNQAGREAFEAARQFWINSGVPVRVYQKVAPVPLTELRRLSLEQSCAEYLIKLFGEVAA